MRSTRVGRRGATGAATRTTFAPPGKSSSTSTLLLAFALLSATACLTPVAKPVETPIQFEPNSGNAVAAYQGSFLVPENRSRPESRQIKLSYVRFPATTDAPGAPIVYLAGGPGGSGTSTAKGRRFPLFMAMRQFGDVIAFDQRGTGASTELPKCESSILSPDSENISDDAFADLYRSAAQECLEFWDEQGVDLLGYTTAESVRDLDHLREHLGAEKISLWGISYGSHLSLAALRSMDDRIERVVLASVEGLDQTVKLPGRTDAYFARLQAAIDRDSSLGVLYPDLKETMRRVHDRLESAPIPLDLSNEGEPERPLLLQRRDLQMLASSLIADPEWALRLAGLYKELDRGNPEPIRELFAQHYAPREPISFRPMSLAMDVASGVGRERARQIESEARHSLLADYLNFPMPHLDGFVSGLDLGEDFRRSPESDVPVLVLSGTLDGRTYVESQREAVAGLRQVEIVVVENAGHNLFMSSPEVTARIESFMRGEASDTDRIRVELPGSD